MNVSRELIITIRWFVCGKWRNLIAWRILQFALWLNNTSRPAPRKLDGWESCGNCKPDKMCPEHNKWLEFPARH